VSEGHTSPTGTDAQRSRLRWPSALKHRGFRDFVCANTLATIAAEMQTVAIGWQVYQLTGSFAQLGLIGLAQFAPFVLLVLPAGQFADHHDRGRIATLCLVAQVLGSALLLLFAHYGAATTWPVYLVLVLLGAARAFMMPAAGPMPVSLVPAAEFGAATALHSSVREGAGILGPVLGGFLYLAGPQVVYGLAVLLFVLAVAFMARVRVARVAAAVAALSWHGALEGLRFMRRQPVVLGAISLDLAAVLLGGCSAVLPAYASDVLHTGPQALGILRTAPGLGALVVATLLTYFPLRRRVGAWLYGGVTAFGLATIVFAVSSSFWLSLAMLTVMGAGDMVSVVIRQVLVQASTPDSVRGRVGAINALFIGASAELGEFESGMLASAVGLVPSVVLGGCAVLVVLGAWAWLFPGLRRADRFPSAAA
jgi:MFS family permease